jgi:hypothetical protein
MGKKLKICTSHPKTCGRCLCKSLLERRDKEKGGWTTSSSKCGDGSVDVYIPSLSLFLKKLLYEILWDTA